MLKRAFSILNRNAGLVIIPAAGDIISLLVGLLTAGFVGAPSAAVKIVLSIGLPSITDVLDNKYLPGASSLNFADISSVGLLIFILFFLAGVFLEAGYIGLLYEAAVGKSPSAQSFFSYARRFWGRFLFLRIIIFLVSLLVLFTSAALWLAGVIVFIVAFLVLRILYIYWEFTIVSEDLDLTDAFNRSRRYYDKRSPELSGVIISIFVLNFLAGLAVNLLWHPLAVFLGIFIYAFLAAGLQLALMLTKPGITETAPPLVL